MSSAEEVAQDHVAAFNEAVAGGSFDHFVGRFADGAVLRFENVPGVGALEFAGRTAIASAYREQPPDDLVDIVGEAHDERGTIVIPFAWRRDHARGVMRITRDASRIARMTVIFE